LGGSEIVRGTLSRGTSLTGLTRAQPGDNLTDTQLLLSRVRYSGHSHIRRILNLSARTRVSPSIDSIIRGLCEYSMLVRIESEARTIKSL
jgi:hypothetical protein